MASKVFVVDADGGLQPLEHAEFLKEKQLDTYIEKFPELLANALSSEEGILRFVLVETQAGIDDAANNTAARWAADALFLDQFGVLTIVENKLAKNPEIRRKIVGQMIEYAANLVQTINADGLLQRLQDNTDDDDVEAVLAELLQLPDDTDAIEVDIAEFWARVEDNLQVGKVRMVFAADRVPSELRHIIEFLNRHMSPMEVLGVSVDCMRDPTIADGREVLVTSTIGLVGGKTRGTMKRSKGESLSKEDFLHACRSAADDSSVGKTAKRIITKFAECDALEFLCHRTPGGDSVCRLARKGGGEQLLRMTIKPTGQVRYSFGKQSKLKPKVQQLAQYDVPFEGKLAQWCAVSETNEQQLIQWIIDAATH